MTVSGGVLFLVRGDQLLKYDVGTLKLLGAVRLPAAGAFDAVDAPRAEATGQAPPAPRPVAPEEAVESVEPLEPAEVGDGLLRGPLGGAAEPLPDNVGKVRGAVQSGLMWLVTHQDSDGHWDADGFMKHDGGDTKSAGAGNATKDVGVTALSLLTLLGSEEATRAGPLREAATRAAAWLVRQQGDRGVFGTGAAMDFVYDHAIATFAVSEASIVLGDKALRRPAQRGIDYLETHRNPYAVWRYQPRDNDNDTSVTTWAALAYLSGRDAGLKVNAQALQLVGTWLDQVTGRDGRTGYTKAGEPSSRKRGDHMTRFPPAEGEAMTAAGVCLRLLLGQERDGGIVERSIDLLVQKPPTWDPARGSIDPYYWLLGTLALQQVGGEAWQTWSTALSRALLEAQRSDGTMAGSWDPVGVWDGDGGRVYSTAMCTLALAGVARRAKLAR
ncbi:MAG: hypothetical protein AB7O84_08570 [Planctomycetota bacterium]